MSHAHKVTIQITSRADPLDSLVPRSVVRGGWTKRRSARAKVISELLVTLKVVEV